jgi:predicted DNA-binding transcriptional regulator AlpA
MTLSTSSAFLNEKEVSKQLSISLACLRKWRMLNRGPVYKHFGRSVRYPVRELDSWLDSRPSGGGEQSEPAR